MDGKRRRVSDVVSALRAAWLSCRRSGRRQTDSILWSSTLKPSSNFTVRFFLLLLSFTGLEILSTNLLLPFSGLDTNDDKVLDEQELEALFTKEVSSVQKNTRRPYRNTQVQPAAVIIPTRAALFSQLEKVYDPKNEEDDMMEMEEERLRMREYFMKNVSLLQLF